jgi:mycothiol synthase
VNLELRKFVLGKDEEVWVGIVNLALAEDPEWTPTTADEFRVIERSPGFSAEGRFIAELDGEPVGCVNGYVDSRRKEKKGFLRGPEVVPEHRCKGIGMVLAKRGIESLKERGMEVVHASAPECYAGNIRILEKLGFTRVREFSRMTRSLRDLPSGIGENQDVELVRLGRTKEDALLLMRLVNDAFSEHFDHRDGAAEEEEFWLKNAADLGYCDETVVARIEGEPVGFLISGYNEKENEHLGLKRGWLYSIGVLKPFRGRGLAKRLMLHGLERLAAQGLTEAALGVDNSNVTGAFRLYESLGFAVARRSFAYELKLT